MDRHPGFDRVANESVTNQADLVRIRQAPPNLANRPLRSTGCRFISPLPLKECQPQKA